MFKIKGLTRKGKHVITNMELVNHVETTSLGYGKWGINVIDANGSLLKEFIGSNGTWGPADPLWEYYDEWCKEAHHSYMEYVAPDGATGSWKYFLREASKGHLHGCVVVL